LLEAFEDEKEIAVNDVEMSQVVKETRAYTSLLNLIMFASIQRSVNKYVTVIKELEDTLLFDSKFANKEHKRDIAKGYIFRDIQQVRVAAVSTAVSGAMVRTMFAEIYGVAFGTNSRVKA